jgi:hypothetical protein
MRLTRDFKETIRARAARDPKFRKELSAKASMRALAATRPRRKPSSAITSAQP